MTLRVLPEITKRLPLFGARVPNTISISNGWLMAVWETCVGKETRTRRLASSAPRLCTCRIGRNAGRRLTPDRELVLCPQFEVAAVMAFVQLDLAITLEAIDDIGLFEPDLYGDFGRQRDHRLL